MGYLRDPGKPKVLLGKLFLVLALRMATDLAPYKLLEFLLLGESFAQFREFIIEIGAF
jgi:hypothetical protein